MEIGFGEGFYLWEILKEIPDIKVVGYDISPYAIEFASRMLTVAGILSYNFELHYGNIFEGIDRQDESVDFATLAEVIEHIPRS
ncbi:class I SAM-dependent methyltransferase [Parabacteroides sp.]|uniref:class I SAM-dependent methyltransferase n=1 Tax=Parabacteroides sp. TaxID=1869337 RepID=UPI00257F71E7|nr:class I SAM-dependent methyltransferase [Parabacteroides sp.]